MNKADVAFVIKFAEEALSDAATAQYDSTRLHLGYRLPKAFYNLTDAFNEASMDTFTKQETRVAWCERFQVLTVQVADALKRANLSPILGGS